MVSAIGRAAFGEGLSRGFNTGSQFMDRLTQRNIQQQMVDEQRENLRMTREAAQQKQMREQAQFVGKAAQEDIATLASDIRSAVEANNPEAAQALLKAWTVPLEGAGGRSRLGMRVQNMQALGLPVTEEGLTGQLQALASGAITPEEAATRETQASMAGADVVAQRYGVSPKTAAQGAGLLPAPVRPSQNDVLVPILQKLAAGQPITEGERNALMMARSQGGQQVVVYDQEGRPVALVGGSTASLPGGGTVVEESGAVAGPAPSGVAASPAAPMAATGRIGLGPALPGTQRFGQDQRLSLINNTIERIDEQLQNLETDPEDFGIIGSLRGGAQQLVGIAEDLASVTGNNRVGEVLQFLAGKVGQSIYDPTLPEIEKAENLLATRLALLRANRPGNETRALQSFLNDARRDVKLTGFSSSREARESLENARQIFMDERNMLIEGLSGQTPAPLESPEGAGGPPAGARTATNPETGEKVYQDPNTGTWVPY